MISRTYIQIIAVIIIMAMIVPQFVIAEITEVVSTSVELDSINADIYDSVVNIANASSAQNPNTWNPAYQGVWIGGSTEESIIELNQIATDQTGLFVATEFTFSSSQIMSGASSFVVRLPIINSDPTDIYCSGGILPFFLLKIYSMDTGTTYELNETVYNPTFGRYGTIDFVGTHATICEQWVDSADDDITEAEDQYTVDDRVYVFVTCPIISNQRYLFTVWVEYVADARMQLAISPNDIARDNVTISQVKYEIPINPLEHIGGLIELPLDLGWSFDFRSGLSSGMFAKEMYLPAGTIIIWTICPNQTTDYHSLMMPFGADSNVSFSLEIWDHMLNVIWSEGATEFTDYILFGSDNPIVNTHSWLTVHLTLTNDALLTLFFIDKPGYDWTVIDDPLTLGDDQHIWATPLSSYLVTTNEIDTPIIYDSYTNVPREEWWLSTELWGFIAGAAYIAGGIAVFTFNPAVGSLLVGVGISLIVATNYQTLSDYYDGAKKWFGNMIDGAMDLLNDFFDFIYAIGEGIWEVIQWLVDQIVEYGSYLLGLLVVAVALLIFFFPIHYQLKLWTSALLLSKGKVEAASKELTDVAKDIGDKAGKIRGLI